jgi:putative ABC transport system ATP-binding protein
MLEVSIPWKGSPESLRSFRLAFTLEDKQAIWLMGPSGIGKTTFLRAIARLVEIPDTAMSYRGTNYRLIEPRKWRRLIHYVCQKPVLFPGSVLHNIQKPFTLAQNRNEIPEISLVKGFLERLLLPPSLLERDALTLSVGETSRICLIRSILSAPAVLLLDEPTASLDLASRRAVAMTLSDWLNQTGRGLVGVTHDEILVDMVQGFKIDLGNQVYSSVS